MCLQNLIFKTHHTLYIILMKIVLSPVHDVHVAVEGLGHLPGMHVGVSVVAH